MEMSCIFGRYLSSPGYKITRVRFNSNSFEKSGKRNSITPSGPCYSADHFVRHGHFLSLPSVHLLETVVMLMELSISSRISFISPLTSEESHRSNFINGSLFNHLWTIRSPFGDKNLCGFRENSQIGQGMRVIFLCQSEKSIGSRMVSS